MQFVRIFFEKKSEATVIQRFNLWCFVQICELVRKNEGQSILT
jgi:hypothetical protein